MDVAELVLGHVCRMKYGPPAAAWSLQLTSLTKAVELIGRVRVSVITFCRMLNNKLHFISYNIHVFLVDKIKKLEDQD